MMGFAGTSNEGGGTGIHKSVTGCIWSVVATQQLFQAVVEGGFVVVCCNMLFSRE
jgi:hypothetical protein